jgi:segregation and condensation protein A
MIPPEPISEVPVPAPDALAPVPAVEPPRADAAGEGAVARIHGEPLLVVPQDLYIPPDALRVILESFEGPLDLLLYLIRRQNLDVLDIPMAQLTRQYLEYIDVMQDNRLELAAEYLLMAALLIDIKSRMLLPRPPSVEEDEEDPRAELARRLLEYEQIKVAAERLTGLPQVGRDFELVHVMFERMQVTVPPRVDVDDLRAAWLAVLGRARLNRHHRIGAEELSVREHMSRILRRLRGAGFVEFLDIFDAEASVPVLVVSLLALLELARESLVEITQQAPYAPIHVRLAGVSDAPSPAPTIGAEGQGGDEPPVH